MAGTFYLRLPPDAETHKRMGEPVRFLESYFDTKDLELMRRGLWLRKRVFLREDPRGETEEYRTDVALTDTLSRLHTRYHGKAIGERIGEPPEVIFEKYRTVAYYTVLRYQLDDSTTADMVMYNFDKLEDRYEVVTRRFTGILGAYAAYEFVSGSSCIQMRSKLMNYFVRCHPGRIGRLRQSGIEIPECRTINKLFLPTPTLRQVCPEYESDEDGTRPFYWD